MSDVDSGGEILWVTGMVKRGVWRQHVKTINQSPVQTCQVFFLLIICFSRYLTMFKSIGVLEVSYSCVYFCNLRVCTGRKIRAVCPLEVRKNTSKNEPSWPSDIGFELRCFITHDGSMVLVYIYIY